MMRSSSSHSKVICFAASVTLTLHHDLETLFWRRVGSGCQPARTQLVSHTAPLLPHRRPHTVLHARLDDDQVWMLLPAPLVRGAWLAYPVRRWDGPAFSDVNSRHGRLRDLRMPTTFYFCTASFVELSRNGTYCLLHFLSVRRKRLPNQGFAFECFLALLLW